MQSAAATSQHQQAALTQLVTCMHELTQSVQGLSTPHHCHMLALAITGWHANPQSQRVTCAELPRRVCHISTPAYATDLGDSAPHA